MIYVRRSQGKAPPWTECPVLQRYKFTNVFRQLDRGTVSLRKMLEGQHDPKDIVFNIWWYRLFNLDKHAHHLGFVKIEDSEKLWKYFRGLHARKEKIFTSCHMTTGVSGEPKVETYLRAVEDAVNNAEALLEEMSSMEHVFQELKKCYMIGGFVAYEIVCDLRFRPELWKEPYDRLTWAHAGPGAKRGMIRLGLDPNLKSMRMLLEESSRYLEPHVVHCEWPFELREIEHSLCEFDKYERARLGQGTPRERYRP